MSIRWKLMILLLVIAMAPMMFVAALYRDSMLNLGQDLAEETRRELTEQTSRRLQQLIRDQAATVFRQRRVLEHTLHAQARAVEERLAAAMPPPVEVFWAEDYDSRRRLPSGLHVSDRHFRFVPDAPEEPISVTYDEQVFKLAPGVTRASVADEVACLAGVLDEYRFLYQQYPDLIFWQVTSLESGVHSSYPGHGGYDPDYDPRQREWYQRAKQEDGLTWIGPYFGASVQRLILTASMPVRRPDGSIAGVTAVDISVAEVVKHMQLPRIWSREGRSMLVQVDRTAIESLPRARIIAQPGYREKGEPWHARFEPEWLSAGESEQMLAMLRDLRRGAWGRKQMPHDARDSLWVYGPVGNEGLSLILVLPYEDVIAQANTARQQVLTRTSSQTRITGMIAAMVSLFVLLIALVGSRSVTKPVQRMAAMADRIANGDLEARVQVRSNDEFGRLARDFNAMVPKLQERLRLKQSLDLAMEVQQRLLPKEPPRVDGLDIAGRSIYCDETGGDYYDFLDLSELGPTQLGVAIGDVTGHGVAAAMLMTSARALLRSRATQSGSLSELLAGLNKYLEEDMGDDRFMTFFYMVLDMQNKCVNWASAGHDPLIVYNPADDSFDEYGGSDLPLGVEPDWPYQEHGPKPLLPGMILVAGTDGIWEARNSRKEFFGKEPLREIIRTHADRTSDSICTAVTEALRRHRDGCPQEDDVTLVVIKVSAQ